MSKQPVFLAGFGIVSPVGDDATSTLAALRAGVSGVRLLEHQRVSGPDPEWDPSEPLRAAPVLSVPEAATGVRRMTLLAHGALQGLVSSSRLTRNQLATTPLFVALPAQAAVPASWRLDVFPEQLTIELGARFVSVEAEHSGHVAALRALGRARSSIAEGRTSRAIVLAVDTYMSSERLSGLDQQCRIKSKRGRDGFTPGEAAVALLLSGPDSAAEGGAMPIAVGPVGYGTEPHAYASDRLPTGDGLIAAIAEAAGEAPIEWIVSDQNGESLRAAEWGMVQTRLAERLSSLRRVDHPAAFVGDVGAAQAALALAFAASCMRGKSIALPRALVLSGSDDGARAAVEISAR